MSNKLNILKFKLPTQAISDAELNHLFFGVVRLIKKNAMLICAEQNKEKIDYLTHRLNECIITIEKKNMEIEKLVELNNYYLKKENVMLNNICTKIKQ